MIAPEKTLLLGIMVWCILEITRGLLSVSQKPLKILLVVQGGSSDNFFEQVIRYLMWEAFASQRSLHIAAVFEKTDGFNRSVATLLIKDGLLAENMDQRTQYDLCLAMKTCTH